MKRLEALSKYFYGGQSESEKTIMKQIFVIPKFIEEMIDFSLRNYKVIIGPKGSGKSLLIDYLNEGNLYTSKLSIIVRPKKLNLEEINEKKITSEKVKEAKKQIYNLISEKIGEGIDFAKNTNEKIFKILDEKRKPDSGLKKKWIVSNFFTSI